MRGLAAGAMLTMIAQTMLPEAFDHGGWLTGIMTVIGFLAAIFMGTLDEEVREEGHLPSHASIQTEIRLNEEPGGKLPVLLRPFGPS